MADRRGTRPVQPKSIALRYARVRVAIGSGTSNAQGKRPCSTMANPSKPIPSSKALNAGKSITPYPGSHGMPDPPGVGGGAEPNGHRSLLPKETGYRSAPAPALPCEEGITSSGEERTGQIPGPVALYQWRG
jgi:hypothetical protein